MCGRFVASTPPRVLAERFSASLEQGLEEEFQPSYNLAPTDPALALTQDAGGERVLGSYRWGLVPWWARNPSIGGRLFNARAESLATTRAFRDAFARRRAAVIADGFFEWAPGPAGRRQPLYFRRADGAPMAFAGLSEQWRSGLPGASGLLRTCTIVTTTAGRDLAGVHDRMPVILEAGDLDPWLDGTNSAGPADLLRLLRTTPEATLVHHPVDLRVGDVRNNSPELIVPAQLGDPSPSPSPSPEPLRLFR
jgi:putative SOS response-associated peptidase YedK